MLTSPPSPFAMAGIPPPRSPPRRLPALSQSDASAPHASSLISLLKAQQQQLRLCVTEVSGAISRTREMRRMLGDAATSPLSSPVSSPQPPPGSLNTKLKQVNTQSEFPWPAPRQPKRSPSRQSRRRWRSWTSCSRSRRRRP